MGSVADRLTILLDAFSPWDGISLTYRQFAAELGAPVTEAAVKKWPQRRTFPIEAARLIIARAKELGITGVTLEWVLLGEGPRPEPNRSPNRTLKRLATDGSVDQPRQSAGDSGSQASTTPLPPRRLPSDIAAALHADLSHNEFGQWSSLEVQRTVLWALKDLARRLRVLRFDMGQTFELTDRWAGKIGLPARPAERPADVESMDAESGEETP